MCKFHIQEEKLLTAARRDESSQTMAWRSVIALLTVVLEVAFHAEGKILLLRMRDSLAPRVAPSVQRSGLLHGVRVISAHDSSLFRGVASLLVSA